MGKRQEAAKVTKQKIIDAVKELSQSKGYDEMSIEEITQTAGVAKGTFYVHFKRREDVCAEIAYEDHQKLAEAVSEKNMSAAEKITWYLKASADVVEKNTLGVSQQWFKAVVAPESDEWLGTRKLNFDIDLIKRCLDEASDQGNVSSEAETEKLARMIVSEFYGAIILWCMSDGKIGFREITENFCDTILPWLFKKDER